MRARFAARGLRVPESAILVGVLLAVLLLAAWSLALFRVDSDSMRETLLPGDFVLVLRPTRADVGGAVRAPARGEVVVLEAPDHAGERVVKRVIAIPGQTVAIAAKRVIVDGDTLAEPWAIHTDPRVHPAAFDARDNLPPVTLGPGELFVLGDNRDDSEDSRFWGPVRESALVGRGVAIYWSWDERSGQPRWERILRRLP